MTALRLILNDVISGEFIGREVAATAHVTVDGVSALLEIRMLPVMTSEEATP